MTVHIDDWGTRRQYTSKVVQGTGGGGGDGSSGGGGGSSGDAALSAHISASDPHPQYITAAKLAAALAGQRGRSYFISQI